MIDVLVLNKPICELEKQTDLTIKETNQKETQRRESCTEKKL